MARAVRLTVVGKAVIALCIVVALIGLITFLLRAPGASVLTSYIRVAARGAAGKPHNGQGKEASLGEHNLGAGAQVHVSKEKKNPSVHDRDTGPSRTPLMHRRSTGDDKTTHKDSDQSAVHRTETKTSLKTQAATLSDPEAAEKSRLTPSKRVASSPIQEGTAKVSATSHQGNGSTVQEHFHWVQWKQSWQEKEEIFGTGLGEGGQRVQLRGKLNHEERKAYEEGWRKHSFNKLLSDRLSVNRSLPDVRPRQCRELSYPQRLPDVSVVICFHNEAPSALHRSVVSVLTRSPPALLKEIVLVDDFSSSEEVKDFVGKLAARYSKVKLVLTKRREGLIRARMLGARVATASALVFLDSHVECTQGWLPPLLARVAQNWSHVVAPVIDVIDKETFEYMHGDTVYVGHFSWRLVFDWTMPDPPRTDLTSPIRSPTMAGGLFAISRDYFYYLGQYDPGMDIWGGENLEISFRIWMCGGTLEILPCSHVGHVFRTKMPYSFTAGSVQRNLVRVAEVWMDEYKQEYYKRQPRPRSFGDVSERKALRERLKCRSFQWYLENVYTQHFLPSSALREGLLKLAMPGLCLTRSPGGKAVARPCQTRSDFKIHYLSKLGEVRKAVNEDDCLDAGNEKNDQVIYFKCHRQKGNQLWEYDPDRHRLYSPSRRRCLGLRNGTLPVLEHCTGSPSQEVIWTNMK